MIGIKFLASVLLTVTVTGVPGAGSTSTDVKHGPPDQMVGLNVVKEDIAKTLAQDKSPLYTDRVGLYSLRDPSKLLEATLEIGHFRSGYQTNSTQFQQSIVGNIGSTQPITIRLGVTPVYISSAKGLVLAVWFNGDYMLTLAIRRTFQKDKELLREALGVNP